MNAEFCPNKASKEFREMSDIFGEDKAYFLWMRNGGNHLEKAPNGADSKLFRTLLDHFNGNRSETLKAKAKTYTNEFIRWFGDWTGNYEDPKGGELYKEVSKVVDENGEPLIVYHGTNSYGFEEFDPNKADDNISIFATDSKFIASTYTDFQPIYYSLVKDRLNNQDFINAILNKDWETAKRIVKSIYDTSVSREEQVILSGSYGKYQYLNSPMGMQESEDERNSILSWASDDEEMVKRHFSLKIETQPNGDVILRLEDDNDEGGRFINTAVFFIGTPELLLESIQKDTKTYSLYLNIKHPLVLDKQVGEFGAINNWDRLDFSEVSVEIDDTTLWGEKTGRKKKITRTRDVAKYAKEKGYDGVLFGEIIDHGGYSGDIKLNPVSDGDIVYDYFHEGEDSYTGGNIYKSNVFIAFDANQLKSVTNKGQFSTEHNNIYHNLESQDDIDLERKLFADYIDRQNKWLSKQDYMSMSDKQRKILKDNLHRWFDLLGFKHFRLVFGFDKNNYVLYGKRGKNASRDASDVDWLLKLTGINVLDNSPKTLSDEEMGSLFLFLDSQVRGLSQHLKDVVSVIKQALKGHSINIQFVNYIDGEIAAQYDYFTNTITINRSSVFRNDNGMSNVVSQTLLHELIHAVTVNTIQRSPELRLELQNLFNKVKNSSEVAHYNAEHNYGLTNMYEFLAELSDKNFVKLLQNIHTGSERKSLISQIKDFIHKVVNKIFTRINANHLGTAYADAMEMFVKAALPEDFDINTNNKVLDELTIFNSISSRQQAAQDEANRLITRMNVLHKQYEKMKSKTPSQERLANQIFETLNKLKQHRDISAVQIALDQAKLTLGQYDPTTGSPVQMSSIYKYLYDTQLNGFAGVSPQALVDMYRNSIKFYKDLIDNIPSEQAIDLTAEDKNSISDLKSLIDDHIMPIWTQAIMLVGDQIVDDQIDSEVFSSEENKEDMKKVAKDWLHKNLMYGDITAVTSYVYNYSYSSNPIIKLAFHLILAAELKTLEEIHGIAPKLMKAYQKANTGMRSITPGWQSMMMEYDDKGIPTGNFIRNLNYGLYQKDLKEFLNDLNDRFIKTYGFTYVVDDTGAVVNSLTGEFADDEEWGPNGEMPKYIEYLKEIEYFKSDRVFRRYVPKYYFERLSIPYNGTIDPLSPEFTGTRFNHGLSPKTLSRYTYYQSNINYYLNKCQDSKTGLIYPEKLSYDDQLSLDRWKDKMDKFISIFNEDGSYKTGEDLKMAYEVRAWLKWIGDHAYSKIDQDAFNQELHYAKQDSIDKGDPRIYNDFVRYNSRVGINPDFIEQTVGDMRSLKSDTDYSFKGKLLRASLQNAVDNKHEFGRELLKMIKNPLFWLHCKLSDLAIETANNPDNESGWDPNKVDQFLKNFYLKDILYKDEYGFYVDENGNKVNPQDPSAKTLEDAGKLLTFRLYLINTYTDEALRTGSIAGLIDESTGASIDFSGLTESQIRNQIHKMLSYKKTFWDEDGNIDRIEEVPLTIFSMLAPTKDTFFNKHTNRKEPTVIIVGDNRFKESTSLLLTPIYQFDPKNNISELPNKDFDGGRYDNREAYDKVMNDDAVRELYDLLISTMLEMQEIYSTNRKFNYKIPQINAHTAALFSRILKRGYSEKSLLGLWNSITNIEENDDLLRTKQDYFVGVDGEVANDVPLKFIRDLKNKENLSTDLVSSVIMFADMALNYKNKSKVDSKLKILRYNMDKSIRDVYESKLKPKSEQSSKDNSNSIKMFDSMMDTSMYGNKFGQTSEGGPSKTRVALHKTADAFLNLESTAMLGLNMFSMAVGFGDSLTRIFSESVAGKYMTIGDCLWSLGKVLYYTPACIKNMFNPLANNKMTALMQMNGISKGTFGTYVKADWGKGRKFLSGILMGGWSMLDWMANALLMTAFYHNCRFFEGIVENGILVIKPGFYTKYELQQEFLRIGKTKSEANRAHNDFGSMMNVTEYEKLDSKGNVVKGKIHGRITLWDAYQFAPYYTDENGQVKKAYGQVLILKEYEPYVTQRVKTNIATKTKKRGALYNGMNPDNDVPRWKRDVIGRLAGALRGWIVQQIQHLISGGTDNVVKGLYEELEYESNTSGTRLKKHYKNLTQGEIDAIDNYISIAKNSGEDINTKEFKKRLRKVQNHAKDILNSKRMSWDYETGTPQDQILIGLWRSFKTLYREANQYLLHKPHTAKLSEVEKYAWKDTLIFLGMLSMMMVGWTFVHDDAREVKKPTSREEAGPASMLNPVDYYQYIRDVYIPNQYWKLATDDIYFRIVEAKISNVNPQLVLDIVNALTALKSGLDDQLGMIGLASDIINEENTDEVLKQGAYKFYTKGERSLYRAIGPVKNMHTFLTYYGATNNLRWYTNKFGKVYRAFGYDFKAKDKEKDVKSSKKNIKVGKVSKSEGIKIGKVLKNQKSL